MRINANYNLVSESKPARAIRRGSHGLTNKHGLMGAYFAERKRKKWLELHNKPYIKLTMSV